LIRNGEKIQAKVLGVNVEEYPTSEESNVTVLLYELVAEAKVEGEKMKFYSSSLSYDPSKFFDLDFVDVYYMKRNPEDYYMDITFLPEQEPLNSRRR
jgi:hypothetical protein